MMTIASMLAPAMLSVVLLIAQVGPRVRAWQGMRVLGFMLFIVLALFIVYMIKRIMSK
jgi:hypothetical protein